MISPALGTFLVGFLLLSGGPPETAATQLPPLLGGDAESAPPVVEGGAFDVGGEPLEAGALPPAPAPVSFSGYLDLGVFRAENRGVGFILDAQDRFRSRFPNYAWVLLGDPLSTAVNARGEPADVSGSFAFTHEAMGSQGALSFAVNEVNLDLSASPHPSLLVFVSADVMPRGGTRGSLGDLFEIDYAYVDFNPFPGVDLTLSAGKFDSAFGREYRLQESPDRPGVTPSLLFRYVSGHPLGLKARARFFDQALVVNLAVTNGSSFIEAMEQAEEIDANDPKTTSGRLSYAFSPWEALQLDLGVSGEWGVQARQTDLSLNHWQYGADLFFGYSEDFELRAEFVRGLAPGGGLDGADGLSYRAWSVEGVGRVLPWLALVGRWEQRHAVNYNTDLFVYLIDVQRITAGVRLDLTANVIAKLEYVLNQELEPLPSFANDVVAAALIVRF